MLLLLYLMFCFQILDRNDQRPITIVVVRKLFDNRVDDKSLPGFHKKNIKLFQASFVVIEKAYNQNYGF